MSGNLSFSSHLGKGSTFVVSMPMKLHVEEALVEFNEAEPRTDEERILEQAARCLSDLPVARILVADDNSFNLTALEAMLRRYDPELEFANSGQEVISLWESNTCDLILMDCHMREMDGYQATQAIREAEPAGQRVPIVALTADVLPANQKRCYAACMDDFLAKPVPPGSPAQHHSEVDPA